MSDELGLAFQDTAVGLGRLYTSLDSASLPECLGLIDDMPRLRDSLKMVGEKVENRAGELMADKRVTVDGVTWEKSRPPSRKAWDHPALLEAVLDSRLFDEKTGDLVEESPVDRIKAVWGLAGYDARLGALRARNIDPDSFSEVVWKDRPWKVVRADRKRKKAKR